MSGIVNMQILSKKHMDVDGYWDITLNNGEVTFSVLSKLLWIVNDYGENAVPVVGATFKQFETFQQFDNIRNCILHYKLLFGGFEK